MKTLILSIATALLLTATVVTTSFAKTLSEGVELPVTEVSTFNQIEAHGNVELFVTTGTTNSVRVYDDYYNQNELVQEQNGVLRIASYKTSKLVVWITVADLRAITAYDSANIKSFGKLSALELSVKLNNNATAQLNLDVDNADITLNDNTNARFMGFVNESNIQIAQSANINTAKLISVEGAKQYMPAVADVAFVAMAADADELAIVE